MPFAFIESISGGELLLVFVVALLLFGAQRLPGLARQLGRAVEQLRRSAQQVREEFMSADREITGAMDEEESPPVIETDPSDLPDRRSDPVTDLEPTGLRTDGDPTEGRDGSGI